MGVFNQTEAHQGLFAGQPGCQPIRLVQGGSMLPFHAVELGTIAPCRKSQLKGLP
jgi:hypothetical protein